MTNKKLVKKLAKRLREFGSDWGISFVVAKAFLKYQKVYNTNDFDTFMKSTYSLTNRRNDPVYDDCGYYEGSDSYSDFMYKDKTYTYCSYTDGSYAIYLKRD